MHLELYLVFLVTGICYLGLTRTSAKLTNDNEPSDTDYSAIRVRRHAEDDQAQLPEQNNAGSPFFMNPNMQSSYFLGQCVMCPPGSPGPRGATGPQGISGRDGRDQLIIGPLRDYGVTGDNQQTETTQPPVEEHNTAASGVTFTRWGRTSCPSTSQLIYEGVMGSSNDYTQKGSGVNYLCLPLTPTFASTPSRGQGGANIYGVELEDTMFISQGVHQSEAPCAVCLAPTKETVIMIPGTNSCLGTQNWNLEYQGYVMSSHNTHFKSEFICIDQNAEGIPRTTHSNDEALLYVADAKCSAGGGGLPCPPYVDNYDILCAVCSL